MTTPIPTATTALYLAGQPALNNGRAEVAFVLDNVANWQTLAAGVRPGVEVVVLDSQGDGLAQMANWLAQKAPGSVDAIHLLSHGSSGVINLGAMTLDGSNLSDRANTLAQIGNAITADGDWLVYGCRVAEGQDGYEFVQQLAAIVGVDVAASDDNTGSIWKHADWELELNVGAIDTTSISVVEYENTLAADTQLRWEPADTTGDDSGTSLNGSYSKDGFTVTSNGYIESDSFQIAVGTHAAGSVSGGTFTRTASGTPTTITIERTDGSEVWFKSLNFGSMFTGSADVASQIDVQAFKDGVAVSPLLRGKLSTSGNHFFNHPGFMDADKIVVSTVESGKYLRFSLENIRHNTAVNVSTNLDASLAPADIAIVGYHSDSANGPPLVEKYFSFIALADIPGNKAVFFTDAPSDASGLSQFNTETMAVWITPAGGVTAGTVIHSSAMPGTFYANGVDTNTQTANVGRLNLSTSGDSIAVYQIGTLQGTSPSLIYSINMDDGNVDSSGFSTLTSIPGSGAGSLDTGLPPGLTAAANGGTGSAWGLLTEIDNAYIASGVLTNGMTRAQVLEAIHTISNWTTNDSAISNFTTVVTPSITLASAAPSVTLSVNNASVAEAAGTSTVTATLSAAASADTTVTIGRKSSSTAALTSDFTFSSTTITITAGNTTGTATLTAVQDTLDEADETVIVEIAGVSGGGGATENGTQEATVTITDDDPTPSLSIANASLTEGNSGSSNMTVTVTLGAASGRTVTVDYATSDNASATAGVDYTAASGTLTFAAGETSKTFTVPVLGDTTQESNETFTVTLSKAMLKKSLLPV